MPLINVTTACAVSVLPVEAHRLRVHAASRRALPTAQSSAGLVAQFEPLAPPHGPFPILSPYVRWARRFGSPRSLDGPSCLGIIQRVVDPNVLGDT